MKKSMVAGLIAFLMTVLVAAAIFLIGGAALLNRNSVPLSTSPVQASGVSAVTSPGQTDQIGQLQSLISQYQDREQQYQQREQQLQSQLAQANTQIQQDQQMIQQVQRLLEALQQRGLIQVTSDGRIFITQ